mmetsp:Transcript_14092/g.33571  ORF Transcript_14092/g.33571 Transcript_14092/m.33571 type:complete len:220 (+) Transcript_14092:592-1251(+)
MCPLVGKVAEPSVLLNHVFLLQPRHDILHEFDLALHGHVHSWRSASKLRQPNLLPKTPVLLNEVLHTIKAAPVAMDGDGIDPAAFASVQELLHPRCAFANVSAHCWAYKLLNAIVASHLLHLWPDGCCMPRVHVRLRVNVGLIEAQQCSKMLTTCTSGEASVVDHWGEIHPGIAPPKVWVKLPIVAPGHTMLQCMQLVLAQVCPSDAALVALGSSQEQL